MREDGRHGISKHLDDLSCHLRLVKGGASDIAPGVCERRHQSQLHRGADPQHDNWNRRCCALGSHGLHIDRSNDEVDLGCRQVSGKLGKLVFTAFCKAINKNNILAFLVSNRS